MEDIGSNNSKSFITLAQYLSGMSARQDIGSEIGKAFISILQLDVCAFGKPSGAGDVIIPSVEYEDENGRSTWQPVFFPQASNSTVLENAAGKIQTAVMETLESGFLSTLHLQQPEQCAFAVLPVLREQQMKSVLIVGKRNPSPFTKPELNVLLAEAGLAGTTISRLEAEKELREHRKNLEALVRKKTEELQQEIARRKKVEEDLLRIFDAMEDRVYLVNRDYEIEYMNPAFKRDFRCSERKKCYEYLNPEKTVCPWCRGVDVLSGRTVRWEWYSQEQKKTYDMISTPLQNSDGSTSMLNIFRDITERKRNEEKISLLLREVHHRIKNNMSTVIGILSLQERTVQDPAARGALQTARDRITSMMVLYDKLYRNTITGTISMKEYLNILVDEIVNTYHKKVSVVMEIDSVQIPAKIAAPLGIIVNELVSNAMKYAFTESGDNVLTVNAECKNRRITLCVRDNGNGFPLEKTSGGFGMELVDILTEQIRGRFTVEEDDGVICTLEFGLEPQA